MVFKKTNKNFFRDKIFKKRDLSPENIKDLQNKNFVD